MFTKNTKELKKGLQEWILKIKLKGLKEKQHLFKNSLKIKCSEMTFLMFFWVSKIYLDPDREEAITNCFVDQNVQFAYSNNIDDFIYLIIVLCLKKALRYLKTI